MCTLSLLPLVYGRREELNEKQSLLQYFRINEMGGNVPGGNFLGESFPEENSPGGKLDGLEFSKREFSMRNFSRTLNTSDF